MITRRKFLFCTLVLNHCGLQSMHVNIKSRKSCLNKTCPAARSQALQPHQAAHGALSTGKKIIFILRRQLSKGASRDLSC